MFEGSAFSIDEFGELNIVFFVVFGYFLISTFICDFLLPTILLLYVGLSGNIIISGWFISIFNAFSSSQKMSLDCVFVL